MKISVIIPCYNEADTIKSVIKAVPKEVLEIVVIDNNSTDKTEEIAKGLGARVVNEKKQGYGAALKRGFKEARGEIIATLDGDGQYPAEMITEIANYLIENNLDFISCSRFPLKNKNSLVLPRRIGNLIFVLIVNFLFGLNLKDSQSGMWVFKKAIFNEIKLESDDMPLSEEIKIKVAKTPKLKFGEYPIPYYPRKGTSKFSFFKHGLINFAFLINLKIKNW